MNTIFLVGKLKSRNRIDYRCVLEITQTDGNKINVPFVASGLLAQNLETIPIDSVVGVKGAFGLYHDEVIVIAEKITFLSNTKGEEE